MKKTFTLCQIAIDLPFQNEQLTVHDLPLSNDGEHDPIEIRSFSCLADAQAELEATRSSINLRRDFEHSPKAWVGTVFFLSELIQDGSSFHSGPDRTGPISIEQWVPCLSDIDPLDILGHKQLRRIADAAGLPGECSRNAPGCPGGRYPKGREPTAQ